MAPNIHCGGAASDTGRLSSDSSSVTDPFDRVVTGLQWLVSVPDRVSFALPSALFGRPMVCLTSETDTAHEIFEASVRAESVKARTKQDARVKSLFVAPFEQP
jgi:hypothetical protein